jgi:hypothetical protein
VKNHEKTLSIKEILDLISGLECEAASHCHKQDMFDIMSQPPVAIQNDEGEQSILLLQLPPLCSYWCGAWHCPAGGGHDLSSCLAEPLEFVVLFLSCPHDD